MSWFSLNEPFGSDYTVDPEDIVNTKTALSDLGYYEPSEGVGIQPWTDNATFDGIKNFQQDNELKVDGFMRPGGPTEERINYHLAKNAADGESDQEKEIQPGMPKGKFSNMPVVTPAWNPDPKMPVLTEDQWWADGAYLDRYGNPRLDGVNPKNGRILRPMKDI